MNSSVITVKMPIDLRAAVRAKSAATGVSLSAVVRSALADERPIVEPADLDAQLDAVSTDARCCVSR